MAEMGEDRRGTSLGPSSRSAPLDKMIDSGRRQQIACHGNGEMKMWTEARRLMNELGYMIDGNGEKCMVFDTLDTKRKGTPLRGTDTLEILGHTMGSTTGKRNVTTTSPIARRGATAQGVTIRAATELQRTWRAKAGPTLLIRKTADESWQGFSCDAARDWYKYMQMHQHQRHVGEQVLIDCARCMAHMARNDDTWTKAMPQYWQPQHDATAWFATTNAAEGGAHRDHRQEECHRVYESKGNT